MHASTVAGAKLLAFSCRIAAAAVLLLLFAAVDDSAAWCCVSESAAAVVPASLATYRPRARVC